MKLPEYHVIQATVSRTTVTSGISCDDKSNQFPYETSITSRDTGKGISYNNDFWNIM
jgi:hypothetical protein